MGRGWAQMGGGGGLGDRIRPLTLTWGAEGRGWVADGPGWAWMGRWGSRWIGLGSNPSPRTLLGSGGGRYGVVDGPWVQDDPSRSVGERRGLGWGVEGCSGSKSIPRALLGSGGGLDGVWVGSGGGNTPLPLYWGAEGAWMALRWGLGSNTGPGGLGWCLRLMVGDRADSVPSWCLGERTRSFGERGWMRGGQGGHGS